MDACPSFTGRQLFGICVTVRKVLFALLVCLPGVSQAWWNNEWNFRKEITLDLSATGANITESTSDSPVLLRLHAGNFGYFADMKPDGSDLRVVAGDDKTPLQFHIERFDPTGQFAFIWVRLPQLAGSAKDAKIYLYYGNPKAEAAGSPGSTYDANQALVLHFAESQGQPHDSTANGNNVASSTAQLNPASLIGGGVKLAAGNVLTVPSSSSLRLVPNKGLTFSAWVKPADGQSDAYVMALENQGNAVVLGVDGASATAKFIKAGAAATVKSKDLASGQWHYLAVTVSASSLKLYVDGEEVGSQPVTPIEIAGTLTLGGSAGGGHGFAGELDEVQAAGVTRSGAFIQVAARSQGMEAPLVVYGGDAQRESGGVSYFAITMKNVTPDGWVVIGLLAVMFVIALMVMFGKAIYLARVSGGNNAFLKEFQKLRGDPTALDRPEVEDGDDALDQSALAPIASAKSKQRYAMSMLYRLYHHGVQEMTGRIGLKSAGAAAVTTLTPQAVEAIRATMDATLVRLTQRLQSQMVLLTIAIAGGPFLGLLGTVVGVMITFAAIAASGDVNVNSIAPGIAAALAATVAGLAVAIPSLFGYNWLNTRIKAITADMRVFVDEFVARVAEHYS
jgi:biopolymer transport protein ExbB